MVITWVQVAEEVMRRDPSRLVTAASGWDDCEVGHLHLHLHRPPGGPREGPAHLPRAQRGGAGGEVRLQGGRPGGDVGQGEGVGGEPTSRAWCPGDTAGSGTTGQGQEHHSTSNPTNIS